MCTDSTGYCPKHKTERQQSRETQRPNASTRGYDHKWRTLRNAHLKANPLCVMCLSFGKVERATVVDHIVPHKGDDELRLDPSNLQSLCTWHHRQKTAREMRHSQ